MAGEDVDPELFQDEAQAGETEEAVVPELDEGFLVNRKQQPVEAPGDGESDEIVPRRILPDPGQPTQREYDEHCIDHADYRSWCKHCVRGRGMNSQHRKKEAKKEDEKKSEVPRVSMDYFFMSKTDEEAKANPIIGMVDEQTGEKYSRAAGKKGVGENGDMDWMIKDMVRELKAWGHCGGNSGHIILKCDNENASKAVVSQVCALGKKEANVGGNGLFVAQDVM